MSGEVVIRIASLVAVAGMVASGAGCGGDASDTSQLTERPAGPGLAVEAPSAGSPVVATGAAVELEQPAVWPAADVVFSDPVDAAAGFVGDDSVALGDFEAQGDDAGEIVLYRRDEIGAPTTLERSRLLLRRLDPTEGWYVVEARGTEASITTPEAGGSVVAGLVSITGEASGFEANMNYVAYLAGDEQVRYDSGFSQVGSFEAIPYAVSVDLSAVPSGTTVVLQVEADSGIGQGGFSAIPVVVRSRIPETR
jgi:hypothetical protein